MKERFISKIFKKGTFEFLKVVVEVVQRYDELGYKITLRQLYYQLVSMKIIPNKIREYKKLCRILNDARMGGYVDWKMIEDRTREPLYKNDFLGIHELIDNAINWFRLPRTIDQQYYIELCTEKDALTSILQPITEEYHIKLVINRGYSSASAMYRMAQRLKLMKERGYEIIILYLGDHDPSGLDMDRDIEDRLSLMCGFRVEVVRIGLTMEQINEYNLVPDPAKVADPRAKWYFKNYGFESWECDALRPEVLDQLVRESIEEYMDMDLYNNWIEKEDELKEILEEFADTQGNYLEDYSKI